MPLILEGRVLAEPGVPLGVLLDPSRHRPGHVAVARLADLDRYIQIYIYIYIIHVNNINHNNNNNMNNNDNNNNNMNNNNNNINI